MRYEALRVLVINYEFPPVGGGGGNVSASIARHLADLGVEVHILTAHYGTLPRREQKDGYHLYRSWSIRRHRHRCSLLEMHSFLLGAFLPSLHLVRRLRPQILHVHFAVPAGPLAYTIKELMGLPYVITLHGGDIPGWAPEVNALHRVLAPITRRIWREAAAVVAVSQGLKELAQRQYPSVPIRVIPNGVDLYYYQPRGRDSRVEEGVRLLFTGRLVEQKGLEFLLESLAMVRKRSSTPFHLQVLGDGPLRERMQQRMESLELGGSVSFEGWVSQERVLQVLRGGDVFVLPSLTEGMPLGILQAMACGLPIVATQVPGSEELVRSGENGFLVPPGETEALADSLLFLMRDSSLREDMGRRSLMIAGEHDWASIARRYLELFEGIIENRAVQGCA